MISFEEQMKLSDAFLHQLQTSLHVTGISDHDAKLRAGKSLHVVSRHCQDLKSAPKRMKKEDFELTEHKKFTFN